MNMYTTHTFVKKRGGGEGRKMITPRGGPDGHILQTPRLVGIPSRDDIPELRTSGGGSPTTTPRNRGKSPNGMINVDTPMNLGNYQRKRFGALSQSGGEMKQEVVQMLHSIIRNAMLCGMTHMRLQTFRMPQDFQYRYANTPKNSFAIYDSHTLLPFEKTKARISFNTFLNDFFQWLQREGVHFICTTKLMKNKVTFGELPFAAFVHVEAIFIPEDTDLREQTGRILSLWNTVYTAKCLDNSMIQQWNQRALAAIRVGAGHFVVCTLYLEADYTETLLDKETGLRKRDEFTVIEPRDHLTMTPLAVDPMWRLDRKFAYLVGWVSQMGYAWTLTCGWSREEERFSLWAYFTVLLDPLERYE